MAASKVGTTSRTRADAWETVMPLLEAMFDEFKELSKKKPDASASKAKVAVVNRVLLACREVLNDEASLEFLDVLEEDDVPQMSDVVLTLSQYVASMKKFRETYFRYDRDAGASRWAVQK